MSRKKLVGLKAKLFERGTTQRQLARKAGIPESILSLILNGAYIPSENQQARIARALGVVTEELFSAVDAS